MHIKFHEVSQTVRFYWIGEGRKRKQLTYKAWQTISPWNNKTEKKIREELKIECDNWLAAARRLLESKRICGELLVLTYGEIAEEVLRQGVNRED